MHLNHFFLKPLAKSLNSLLKSSLLEEAWSQEKDELVFSFRPAAGGDSLFVRAFMRAELTYLGFPQNYNRARANTAGFFKECYGLPVLGVHAVPFDRSFYIRLADGYQILFKLHGNRSNVALVQEDEVKDLFKNILRLDEDLSLEKLARHPEVSYEAFERARYDAYKMLPQIGTETVAWLNRQGYQEMEPQARWALFEKAYAILQNPTAYYLTRLEGKTQFLLFPMGDVEQTHTDPIEAAQAFARLISFRFYGELARREAIATLSRRRDQTLQYLDKLTRRERVLEQDRPPNELADLIMAQLHTFRPGPGKTVLEDFYRGGTVDVELREGITPQKQAETLYRRARNAHQELDRIKEQVASRKQLLEDLNTALNKLPDLMDVKTIRALVQPFGPETGVKDEESLPYRPVYLSGWEIRIGRNGQANDEMLRKHSHKDDLWLHAKDVSGSHVLIVHKSGQKFPKPVIEAAAGLAAWHSKKRTETLADVIVVPRKFIRKVKGSAPGAVRVEKEDVMLVRPLNIP